MLNQIMGVNVTHVPYRGGGPAFADVIAGRIDYICNYVSIGAAAVKQGQVKAMAMLARDAHAAAARSADRRRAGAEGLRRLGLERDPAAEERDAGDGGEVQRGREQGARQSGAAGRFDAIGLIAAAPDRRSPEYLRKFIDAEIEKWAAPVKASGAAGGLSATWALRLEAGAAAALAFHLSCRRS